MIKQYHSYEIYQKECDLDYSKGICTIIFIAALFTIAQLWKQPRCATTDEWIKKMWYLYTNLYLVIFIEWVFSPLSDV
jgi:hypothetical protein